VSPPAAPRLRLAVELPGPGPAWEPGGGAADQLRAAEDAGFELAWIGAPAGPLPAVGQAGPAAAGGPGELPAISPDAPGDPLVDALACAAHAAAASRSIGIAAPGLVLPSRRVLRVAEDAATADGVAAGRLEVGLLASDAADLEVGLTALRAAWSQAPPAEGMPDVHPKPASPGGPPAWWGDAPPAREAARLAVRLGVGLIASDVDRARGWLDAVPAGSLRLALRAGPDAGPASARAALEELGRPLAAAAAVDLLVAADAVRGPGD